MEPHASPGRLRRTRLALWLAVAGAAVVITINEIGYAQSRETLHVLADRYDRRLTVTRLWRQLLEAETGQRGFLLTGRESYLQPYHAALQDVERSLQRLRDLQTGDALLTPQVTNVEEGTRQKLAELATTIDLYLKGNEDQWRELLMSDIGREKMDELRKAINELFDSEDRRIQAGAGEAFGTLQRNRLEVNLLTLLALVAVLLFLRNVRRLDRAQVAHDLALRTERDRLEATVLERTAELTELTRHLQSAREDERSRLARELHDELGALLTAAKLETARLKRGLGLMAPDVAERLKQVNETLDRGIALKRRIIEDLRPSSLSNLGLVAALEIQAREFAQRAEMSVRTVLQPVSLDEDAQMTVYRLVQESLTNIAKYARASDVTVSLSQQDDQVQVGVLDNGVGFDPASIRPTAHGLLGMRYRIEAEGGRLQVDSAPGEGCQVRGWLPAAGAAD
ncbi:MAG: CHASE3 domain-containing protein [Rubrivivax sp.]|mgnify:CR=1 FL=1|nr:CHASE3 domain-containing protein [Rubrivivax sp.]